MQRVADAVLSSQADPGILRTCVLEQLERTGRVAPGALVVVGARPDAPAACQSSTPLYPGWAFAALARSGLTPGPTPDPAEEATSSGLWGLSWNEVIGRLPGGGGYERPGSDDRRA